MLLGWRGRYGRRSRCRSWRWRRLHRVWRRVGNILRRWGGWRGCRCCLGLRCCLWCSVSLLFSPRCHFGSAAFLFLFLLDLPDDFFRWLSSPGNLANRCRHRLLSGRSTHLRHIRPSIHNNLLRPSGYIPILPDWSSDNGRFVNNCRIVNDHTRTTDGFMKSMGLDKHESGGSNDNPVRRSRRPSAIAASHTPTHPGWSPLHTGNPNPSVIRCLIPIAVMVTGPTPRLVALPVPAAIGPNPGSFAVGTPSDRHTRRPPAAAVGADLDPCTIGR
jgi:hypothetical protein